MDTTVGQTKAKNNVNINEGKKTVLGYELELMIGLLKFP
tara:strand:- start:1227 stop:1343 length:117 start_codon:yes stop_codon:yes gene_type:complete